MPRNHGFGALVRVREPGTKTATTLPRDFGAVHLDGSFDANRLHIDPSLPTDRPSINVTRQPALSRITAPTPDALVQAVIQRDKESHLVANLTMIWPAVDNDDSISHLVIPLINAWGLPQLEQVDNDEDIGAFLALVWSDSKTRLALRLPYSNARPELMASNSDGQDVKTRCRPPGPSILPNGRPVGRPASPLSGCRARGPWTASSSGRTRTVCCGRSRFCRRRITSASR